MGERPDTSRRGIDRRSFLRYSAVAGATASVASALGVAGATQAAASDDSEDSFRWNEATIAELQAAMSSGETTSRGITRDYMERIEKKDFSGPTLNSVIELNPDAEAIAERLDDERRAGHVRGPLHGIPILVKDNVATADRMQTTAGSLALLGSKVPRDAGVAKDLRRGRRRDPGQGQPLRVGQLPLVPGLERVDRQGRAVPDALRAGPQRIRVELGVGGRGRRELRRRRDRHRDRRLDRLSVDNMRGRRASSRRWG